MDKLESSFLNISSQLKLSTSTVVKGYLIECYNAQAENSIKIYSDTAKKDIPRV